MSRTQPKILLELVDKQTYKVDQIVEASGIWAVYYNDQPINLKNQHYLDVYGFLWLKQQNLRQKEFNEFGGKKNFFRVKKIYQAISYFDL